MISSFIWDVCDDLEIEVPKICSDESVFPSETTMAVFDVENYRICIKDNRNPDLDLFFAIAHELRHAWQLEYFKEKYLDIYKDRSEFDSVEEYNLQIAEIDANAYAAVIMEETIHVRPLFKGLSKNVIDKIMMRKQEIMEGNE